ncbi:MAG TPA: OadG family protein [Candidatus Marinimicrobia bacterium]|nr:OadG family protein [Candidatus Neomarinimicrobiota bacterium]HRS51734.1 OadG family protein [Candidatus Neomarinimicrobiota bacterium]HRU92116.1 OadG family protein [Candidatus Neomarinimicrobiota bacterium]
MSPELLNGIIIGIGGLITVFVGLVIIEFVISLFNRYFAKKEQKAQIAASSPSPATKKHSASIKRIAIPEEDVVAIATTIELYRKIHFDQLPSQITFIRGNQQSNWKIGSIASQFLRK